VGDDRSLCPEREVAGIPAHGVCRPQVTGQPGPTSSARFQPSSDQVS